MDAQVKELVRQLQQIPGVRISINLDAQLHERQTNLSFREWAQRWLTVYKRGIVKDNTYYGTYQDPVENHLIPYFGDYALPSIRPEDVQIYFKTLSTVLSEETQKKIRNALKQRQQLNADTASLIQLPAACG